MNARVEVGRQSFTYDNGLHVVEFFGTRTVNSIGQSSTKCGCRARQMLDDKLGSAGAHDSLVLSAINVSKVEISHTFLSNAMCRFFLCRMDIFAIHIQLF